MQNNDRIIDHLQQYNKIKTYYHSHPHPIHVETAKKIVGRVNNPDAETGAAVP